MKQVFSGCILVVLLLLGCEGYDIVMADLPQREANEALVLLREKHIDAKKEATPSKKISLYQVMVRKNQSEEALRILVDHRLPGTDRAGLKDIYPPGGGGLIPTKSEESARFLMASQGEVESLLKVIPGIRDARVVLSFDPSNEVQKIPAKRTASVALLYRKESDNGAPPLDNDEVKSLVASSISGLSPDDVAVVQKAVANIDESVTVTTATTSALSVPSQPLEDEKQMEWYLLAITVLALMVATYGMLRLFMQRRATPV